jgi:hypothetical protein
MPYVSTLFSAAAVSIARQILLRLRHSAARREQRCGEY